MSVINVPSRWRRLYPGEHAARGVPQHLQHAVQVLNEALKIDALLISRLIETSSPVFGEVQTKLLEHPSIVIGEMEDINRTPCLSVLGLINGLVLTDRFRMGGWFNDSGVYEEFFVLEDTKQPPVGAKVVKIRCQEHPQSRLLPVQPVDAPKHWMCMTCGKNVGQVRGISPRLESQKK